MVCKRGWQVRELARMFHDLLLIRSLAAGRYEAASFASAYHEVKRLYIVTGVHYSMPMAWYKTLRGLAGGRWGGARLPASAAEQERAQDRTNLRYGSARETEIKERNRLPRIRKLSGLWARSSLKINVCEVSESFFSFILGPCARYQSWSDCRATNCRVLAGVCRNKIISIDPNNAFIIREHPQTPPTTPAVHKVSVHQHKAN